MTLQLFKKNKQESYGLQTISTSFEKILNVVLLQDHSQKRKKIQDQTLAGFSHPETLQLMCCIFYTTRCPLYLKKLPLDYLLAG